MARLTSTFRDQSPGADKESNWLPAPDDQSMNIEYSLIKSVQSSIRNLIESFRDKTNR